MLQHDNFTITNKTKTNTPRVDFLNIKNAGLGKNYSLSLVFIGEKKSKELNFAYRGKNKPTNILSFPLSKTSGEIFICMNVARREAKSFDRKLDNFIAFLFIHGLTHLKGLTHGDTMERAEIKLRKKFKI